MKAQIELKDRGAQTVEFQLDLIVTDQEQAEDRPTPAAVLAMAVKAMFRNGMLARAGQVALEGASKGMSPEEAIKAHYIENTNDSNT